jgi:hypothetical protein
MMEQLGIKALRSGASGDENGPDHANYDELLANPYPKLPDPLTLDEGGNCARRSVHPERGADTVAVTLPSA